ncbi:unnamed protein product [Paramecium pentaurelia]|uniref:TLDc domain-containing protein n=1 Tax=Paramecium pentaurelia TaxID=43138 RepID=A0A8S1TCJ2_9CILI|nr:unnamed protein product [Paramecium pentaurelia]
MTSKKQKIGIYCQDDQHFHRGQKIKYLMVKQEKGSISKRLFCDECFLGNYNSYQQYCCNLQELINGRIYEAFKYTKFDSDKKQEYFNYARNHSPYQDVKFIENMVISFQEEMLQKIEVMKEKFLEESKKYLEEVQRWTLKENIMEYFECDDFKKKLLDEKFERSPYNFEELNKLADDYVKKINKDDEKMKIDLVDIVDKQKQFFNLEKFKNCFKEVMESIEIMENRTFSNYTFSQSTLATPYIEQVVEKIAFGKEEAFLKNLKRIYRMTQQGSNYKKLQDIKQQLEGSDTITIIQTKNKCVFGVYNCIQQRQKSILFQMNKEKFFQLKETSQQALKLNLTADLNDWILKFGDEDIIINSTFTKCKSNLGNGFDISGAKIFNKKEYLSDCEYFDIYDIEIFETPSSTPLLTPPPPIITKPDNIIPNQPKPNFQTQTLPSFPLPGSLNPSNTMNSSTSNSQAFQPIPNKTFQTIQSPVQK